MQKILLCLIVFCPAACGSSNNAEPEDSETESAPEEDASVVDTTPEFESDTDSETVQDSEPVVEIDTDYETDPSLITLHGLCAPDRYLGGFRVEMNMDEKYTVVDGVVYDVPKQSLILEEVTVDSNCKLLRKLRYVCDPPCESGTYCGSNEICVPEPEQQDMGIAVIQGLVQTLVIKPIQPGNTYSYTRLSHPGFEPDKVIRLTTTEGFMGELDMYGVGVYPLSSSDDKIIFAKDTPLEVEWPAPPEGVRSRMEIEINIDQHGITPVNLICDLPDTGSATISSNMVNAFIQSGVTGFPSGTALRRTADSVETEAGCAEFLITSVRMLNIEVTGYIPCMNDDDCTPPDTCNLEINQCG